MLAVLNIPGSCLVKVAIKRFLVFLHHWPRKLIIRTAETLFTNMNIEYYHCCFFIRLNSTLVCLDFTQGAGALSVFHNLRRSALSQLNKLPFFCRWCTEEPLQEIREGWNSKFFI